MIDLLADNIIKEKIESNSYSWVDGQRLKVIEAMQQYADKKNEQLKALIDGKQRVIEHKSKIMEEQHAEIQRLKTALL